MFLRVSLPCMTQPLFSRVTLKLERSVWCANWCSASCPLDARLVWSESKHRLLSRVCQKKTREGLDPNANAAGRAGSLQ